MSIRNMMIGGAGATAPDAPTGATATKGSQSASVAFSAPANNGGSAITGYRVTSSPGSFTATGSSSPITVTGLTNGTAYTFTVAAQNAIGYGAESSASNSVTPALPAGQQAYTSAGSYTFVVPADVTSVSAVAVGGASFSGGPDAGGGAGLAYKNNISVTPGASMAVVVGPAGTPSVPGAASTFSTISGGTNSGRTGGSGSGGDGNFTGGTGGQSVGGWAAGGGVAGYTGNGSPGGNGGGYDGACNSGNGGGIGLSGGTGGGGGGSPGGAGGANGTPGNGGSGAVHGGGCKGCYYDFGPSGVGGVRIIWGPGRSYPSNAANV